MRPLMTSKREAERWRSFDWRRKDWKPDGNIFFRERKKVASSRQNHTRNNLQLRIPLRWPRLSMRVGSSPTQLPETGLQMLRHANNVLFDAPPTVGADAQPPLGGGRKSWGCSPPNLPNVLELVTDPRFGDPTLPTPRAKMQCLCQGRLERARFATGCRRIAKRHHREPVRTQQC